MYLVTAVQFFIETFQPQSPVSLPGSICRVPDFHGPRVVEILSTDVVRGVLQVVGFNSSVSLPVASRDHPVGSRVGAPVPVVEIVGSVQLSEDLTVVLLVLHREDAQQRGMVNSGEASGHEEEGTYISFPCSGGPEIAP